MTNEKLRPDGTFRAHGLECKCDICHPARKFKVPLGRVDLDEGHPVTCKCEVCERRRQRMRTGSEIGVCQNCDDTGYECQPYRADPMAPYRPCLVCDTGRAREADMIPYDLLREFKPKSTFVGKSTFDPLDKVAIGPQIEVAGPQTPAEEQKPVSDHRIHFHPENRTEKPAKTLHNSTVDGARKNVPDLVVFGDGDTFKLICKASSQAEGWMKSTKAMEIPGLGCVVQVTTQQGDNVAEALCFVPHAMLVDIGSGKQIVRALALGKHIFGGGKS